MGVRSVKDKRAQEERQAVRKVITEFLVQLVFTIIRYGTQAAFVIEALNFNAKIQLILEREGDTYLATNMTRTVLYCVPRTWKSEEISTMVKYYRGMVYTFLFFLLASSLIAIVHIFLWIVFVIRVRRYNELSELEPNKLAMIVRTKFGFIENIVHDIPLTVFGIEAFLIRNGPKNLTCLLCASSPHCLDEKFVQRLLLTGLITLILSLLVIAITTAWRGLTVFFRWSYVKECAIVSVRGCVSIFVGLIYAMMILTPAFIVINYRYSSITGINSAAVSEFVSKLLIMGLLAWSIVILGGCCCPLIRAIS